MLVSRLCPYYVCVPPDQPKVAAIVSSLLAWYAREARNLPWRRTRHPYAIWVAEIMLQQTQVKTVIPFWERWMQQLPTIEALANASPAKIHKLWEGLGYYTRVRNLQRAARVIQERHNGHFPEAFDDVLELPGVGPYTAGAICSIAFNQPKPILDGNVIRVLARVFGVRRNVRAKAATTQLWALAEQLVMAAERDGRRGASNRPTCSHLNQSLMELGALVCTPRSPRCDSCPIAKSCFARRHGLVARLPILGARPVTTRRRFVAFVAESNGRLLVKQRPNGVVNGHLWEFPNLEVRGANGDPAALAFAATGLNPLRWEPLLSLKHSITRYRIHLDVFRIQVANRRSVAHQTALWLTPTQLQSRAFTSAHKKILDRITQPKQP